MKWNGQPPGLFAAFAFLLVCLTVSCQENGPAQHAMASDSVRDRASRMMADIARDVSEKGPSAWLNYFEDTAAFYMAVDGQVVFPDHRSAKTFIEDTLVKNMKEINLRWTNTRIDSLDPRAASIGAGFHEKIILADTNAKILSQDGYFTAIAEQTGHGWQLRNLHWSIAKGK